MKIAYLIPVHANPIHLGRLVGRLSSRSSGFFIHVDAKSDLADFVHLAGPSVGFTADRVAVWWGDYSQVAATLTLIRAALDDPRQYDRFVLLSGADYPLRSTQYVEQFFEQHPRTEFVNMVEMPSDEAGKPLTRLTTYQPGPGRTPLGMALHRTMLGVGRRVHQRDYQTPFQGMVPYGGSTWWALSREACELIVSFVDRRPDFVRFFRHAICPDESFFQTIVGNAALRENVRRNLTFVDWSAGGQNPSAFTEAHLHRFGTADSLTVTDVYGSGELLFARKFVDDDGDLVARLDRLIVARDHSGS